jgi:TetR/AcrR family fatty acid metabolism transcriptional regulator
MSQPARTKQDVVAEFRQAEIIDAARRVIARDGPGKASMERIAEEARISKGTLYLYFDSKDALVQEATERGHAEMAAYVDAALREARSPVGAIEAYIRSTLQFCDEHEMLFRAMNTYPDSEGGAASRVVARHVDGYVDRLEEYIRQGIASGALRPVNARRMARVLVEAVRGIVIERLREQAAVSVADDADMLIGIVLDGVRA